MPTLEQIDAELAKLPASPKTDHDIQARAALMQKRYELENQQRKANAQASRPKPQIIVNAIEEFGCLHAADGEFYYPEIAEDGRRIVRLRHWGDFLGLLRGRDGIRWQSINSEALQQLAAANIKLP